MLAIILFSLCSLSEGECWSLPLFLLSITCRCTWLLCARNGEQYTSVKPKSHARHTAGQPHHPYNRNSHHVSPHPSITKQVTDSFTCGSWNETPPNEHCSMFLLWHMNPIELTVSFVVCFQTEEHCQWTETCWITLRSVRESEWVVGPTAWAAQVWAAPTAAHPVSFACPNNNQRGSPLQ